MQHAYWSMQRSVDDHFGSAAVQGSRIPSPLLDLPTPVRTGGARAGRVWNWVGRGNNRGYGGSRKRLAQRAPEPIPIFCSLLVSSLLGFASMKLLMQIEGDPLQGGELMAVFGDLNPLSPWNSRPQLDATHPLLMWLHGAGRENGAVNCKMAPYVVCAVT